MPGLFGSPVKLPQRWRSKALAGEQEGSSLKETLGPRFSRWLRDLPWYRVVVGTFLGFVALPTLAVGLYYYLVASQEYSTSVRLAVYAVGTDAGSLLDRAGSKQQMSVKPKKGKDGLLDADGADRLDQQQDLISNLVSKLGRGSLVGGDGKDPFLVVDYIRSRAIVSDLDGDGWLRRLYSRDVDFFSRLKADPSLEELWTFFNSRVDARVDTLTRLVTVKVRAFAPEDAQELANRIVKVTENLVNALRKRRTEDQIADATKLLGAAEDRYTIALAAVRAVREQIGVIDPRDSAKALATAVAELKIIRISLEVELSVTSATAGANSPAVTSLMARIQAVDAELDDLSKQISGQPDKGQAVASYLVDFEDRETERLLAQTQYKQAINAFDRAETTALTQGVYLSALAPAGLPETADYPKPAKNMMLAFILCFMGWSVTCFVASGIRDRVT